MFWSLLIVDMAMYTEANDKLHIGKKAKGEAARRLRNEIGELIDDRYVLINVPFVQR